MAINKSGQDDHYDINGRVDQSGVELQALRAGYGTVAKPKPPEPKEKMSIFWQVFGGTILSIVALTFITIYNNFNSNISEIRAELNRANTDLRNEVARANEARGDLIRKDEFTSRSATVWEGVKALQAQNSTQLTTLTAQRAEIDALKDRLNRQSLEMEAMKKDQATAFSSNKSELVGIDVVKERLTATMSELKTAREDIQRMRMEVDRNQASDVERKESRDKQYKHFDELIKELQKGVQDCREKLARLEGQVSPPPATNPAPPKVSPKKGPAPVENKASDETLPPPSPKSD